MDHKYEKVVAQAVREEIFVEEEFVTRVVAGRFSVINYFSGDRKSFDKWREKRGEKLPKWIRSVSSLEEYDREVDRIGLMCAWLRREGKLREVFNDARKRMNLKPLDIE